jgi:hypothetical protein
MVQTDIQAASSSSRTIKKWRVTDLELVLESVRLGLAPIEILMVNVMEVARLFKADPAAIDEIPGMETYDDIQIAGR